MFRSAVVVLAVWIYGCRAWLRVDPLVETRLGLIRGLRSREGYSMFLGVPYARVNESNVFGHSVPVTRFERTFEAYDDTIICPQADSLTNSISGSLDCLTLNIFVPDSASTLNPMPVMVWIHGGAFQVGSSVSYSNGPSYLVRHNVLLVTVQYRLGPYGFLCLDTPDVPGNQGLKDQVTALRWVKDNIGAFGGDSNSITLFGTSAGAMSIDLHLLSQHELLFNRVIMQSGASITPRVVRESDASVPLQLSAQLGFVTDNLDEAMAFLSKADVKLVIAAGNELSLDWRLCSERDFDGVEKFLADFPINMPVTKAKSVAILSGFNNFELAEYSVLDSAVDSDVFAQNLDLIFDFGKDRLEMERVVRHFYVGDEVVDKNVNLEVAQFLSDFTYNYPVQWTVEKYLREGARNVYFYMFSYPGGSGWARHGDERKYLFNTGVELSDEDQLIQERMTTMWTNFAKYGDPTPTTSDLLPVKWTPATGGALKYLDINTEMTVGTRPYNSRLAFWDLYFKVYWEKLRGYKEM